jgi:hypothetical protein
MSQQNNFGSVSITELKIKEEFRQQLRWLNQHCELWMRSEFHNEDSNLLNNENILLVYFGKSKTPL